MMLVKYLHRPLIAWYYFRSMNAALFGMGEYCLQPADIERGLPPARIAFRMVTGRQTMHHARHFSQSRRDAALGVRDDAGMSYKLLKSRFKFTSMMRNISNGLMSGFPPRARRQAADINAFTADITYFEGFHYWYFAVIIRAMDFWCFRLALSLRDYRFDCAWLL